MFIVKFWKFSIILMKLGKYPCSLLNPKYNTANFFDAG